jgi:prepilin-type N-terminal cleavage/methylation domain-containing protein
MRRQTAGFTLIELMISAAVLVIISVYLTGMLTQQNRAYSVVDQVTETQSNLRAVSALMEREIRTTAFMAPEGSAACGVDRDDGPDVLYVTDADAYRNGSSVKRYDLGPKVDNVGFPGDTLRLATLNPDGDGHYDLDADGVGDSDFRPGGGVIVMDYRNPERGTACGVIREGGVTEVPATLLVDFEADAAALGAHNPSRPEQYLVAIPAHRYMIDDENQLLRDDLVLAEDVEDLQVAYFFDVDDDRTIDDGENPGAAGAHPRYVASENDNVELREIRFNVVMRSRRSDPSMGSATFQAFENRTAVAGTDGFRRRTFTASVSPRNVGHRWNSDI